MKIKFGYVSVIGKPNAGKSTLVNSLIGENLAIVTSKPQTTRDNILGILNGKDYQIVFIDTPGIHSTVNQLDKHMMKNVRSALNGVDLIIFVVDAKQKTMKNDLEKAKEVAKGEIPVILVINKIDIAKFEEVYPVLDKIKNSDEFVDVVSISALLKKNLNILIQAILKHLPLIDNNKILYPSDQYTDRSVRFLVSEIIREKALILLREEIPHGIAVVVSVFDDKPKICNIEVEIYCEKDSHKNIIIGKQGSMTKRIGTLARTDIERLIDKKVLLKIWVRVLKDWRNNSPFLKSVGYTGGDGG